MNDTDDNQRVGIGKWALVLFVIGLLFIIVAWVSELAVREFSDIANLLVLGLGGIAEILALVFGIIGRKALCGKIGVIGAIVVLTAAVVLWIYRGEVFFWWYEWVSAPELWRPVIRPSSAP